MYIVAKFNWPSNKTHSKLVCVDINNSLIDICKDNTPVMCSEYSCQKVFIGGKEHEFSPENMIETSLHIKIKDVMSVVEIQKVLFVFHAPIEANLPEDNTTAKDANRYLMAASQRIQFPTKKKVVNGKDELYNSIIEYLMTKNAGFSSNQATDMDFFMDIMSKTLWTLDNQNTKFIAAHGVSGIPTCFVERSFRKIEYNGMAKKPVPNMKMTDLITHATKLEILLSKKFIQSTVFVQVKKDIEALSAAIHSYIDFLNKKLPEPFGIEKTQDDTVTTYILSGTEMNTISPIVMNIYKTLEAELLKNAPYHPLNLKSFAPIPRNDRYFYIRKLTLSFDVQIYKKTRPTISFIWRLPNELENRTDSAFAVAVRKVECELIPRVLEINRQRLVNEHRDRAVWPKHVIEESVRFMNGTFY